MEWADKAAALNNADGMYRAAVLHHLRLSLVLKGGKPFWGFLKEDARAAQKNAAVLIGLCKEKLIPLDDEVFSELLSVLKDSVYCEALACYMEVPQDYQQAAHLMDGFDSPREKALCGVCRFELGQEDEAGELLSAVLEDQAYAAAEKLPAEEAVYSIAAMICSCMKRLNGSPEKAMAVLSGGIGGIRDEALKTSLRKELGRYRRKLFGGWKYA